MFKFVDTDFPSVEIFILQLFGRQLWRNELVKTSIFVAILIEYLVSYGFIFSNERLFFFEEVLQ